MKLLDPKQMREGKEIEMTRDASKLDTIRKALKQKQSELDNTEARFEVALSGQRARWAQEEKEASERISSLQAEINVLESRKKAALVPIEIERERAHNLVEEAKEILSKSEGRKKENDSVAELLQNKLDDVSDRELDVLEREQKIETKEIMVREQESKVSMLSQELSKKWETFYAKTSLKESEQKSLQRVLELRDISIKAREDDIDRKYRALVDKERFVNDKYETLLRNQKRNDAQ